MNSMEEKALFEEYGWEYDYIARRWVAPDGAYILTDSLVMYNDSEENEMSLRQMIVMHGRKQ